MNAAEHVAQHQQSSERARHWLALAWDKPVKDFPRPDLPDPTKVRMGDSDSPRKKAEKTDDQKFLPERPATEAELGVDSGLIDQLIWKFLYLAGTMTSQKLSDELCIPKEVIVDHVSAMKKQNLVVYTGQKGLMDFDLTLTELGRERAKKAFDESEYLGAVPVPLQKYILSIAAQSIGQEKPTTRMLKHAFRDLLINEQMFDILGPAINSARGMFLYGFPGNGKTSIAERITRAFGESIWIPKAVIVDGLIIKLFDLQSHEPVRIPDGITYDRRWVKITRPTIVVGGELTMDQLEIKWDPETRICEAPLQMKSNCGTLVIDDFGRQKMNPDQLLNRWIVPLEKRFDFLGLRTGRKIQVPFDQLIVFSTNLEPRDLVDDAFLRRIPYKINVPDPSEEEFRKLFEIMCPKLGFEHDPAMIDYLINNHYWRDGRQIRPYRCCHPRDLLMQIRNFCNYQEVPVELREEYFDFACGVYFTVMG